MRRESSVGIVDPQMQTATRNTNVDITNTSNYKLIVNRIDTTKNRVGKITIIDTARIDTAALDAKTVYTLDASGVTRAKYSGTLVQNDPNVQDTEALARIDYTLTNDPSTDHPLLNTLTWDPRPGLHYVWTEGQSLTQTTLKHYDKETFNLFGGSTGLEDWLAADQSYKWKTTEFKDPRALLESEALAIEGGGSGQATNPAFTNGDPYGISYVRKGDPTVDVTPGTTVWDVSGSGTTWSGATPWLSA